MVRKDGALVAVSWHEALEAAAEGLTRRPSPSGAESVGVIGGARLTNEGAYAWARLAKGVLGTDSVDAQLGDGLPAELVLGLPRATIDQAASAATVVAADRRRPRGAARPLPPAAAGGRRRRPVARRAVAPGHARSPPYAAVSLRYGPGEAAALVDAPVVDAGAAAAGRRRRRAPWPRPARCSATGVVVVVGAGRRWPRTASWWPRPPSGLADALPGARFLPALRRGNVLGALDMGLAPGLLPGRVSLEDGRAWFDDGLGLGAGAPAGAATAASWPPRPATRPTGRR